MDCALTHTSASTCTPQNLGLYFANAFGQSTPKSHTHLQDAHTFARKHPGIIEMKYTPQNCAFMSRETVRELQGAHIVQLDDGGVLL
jgi:hypothetical protein